MQELEMKSETGDIQLKFLLASGFQNIQNVVRMLKKGNSGYHYIELMACPMGCLNGGGQLSLPNTRVDVPDMLHLLRRSEDWVRLSSAGTVDTEQLRVSHTVVDRPQSLRW